jgi:predicted nucleotidyltransferase component of viral defense system
MITHEQITDIAERLQIDSFTVVREYLQVVFLGSLCAEEESHHIFFKGGTAIHLLFKAPRFSEDLDFSTTLNRGQLESAVDKTLTTVRRTIPGVDFKMLNEGEKAFAGQLRYAPANYKFPLTVHVDFSMRERPLTKTNSVLETDFPLSFHPVIRHLAWEEILAEKVRAFTLRAKGRDIYDMWFLLSKGITIDWKMVSKKLAFYEKKVAPEDIVEKVMRFDEKRLKQDLEKFLSFQDRKILPHLKEGLLRHLSI